MIEKNENKHLKWNENSKKKVLNCGIFDVIISNRKNYKNQNGDFVILDTPDWITVIPLIKNEHFVDCFLMVKQFRHGSQSITVEFPAGVIEANENPITAGKRELLEETGFQAGSYKCIGEVNPNPAFMNNTLHIYVMWDLKRIQKQDLDEHELIDYELIPVKQVIESMGNKIYSNGIMMIALGFYTKWTEKKLN